MHFNTYEDMEKAVANERLFGSPESIAFVDAMLEVFEQELEDACEKAAYAGYDDGYEAGGDADYEEGWQKGYDEAREQMRKGA